MAVVLPFGEHAPALAPTSYLARTATVIGDAVVEDDVSIWFGAVVRADGARITVGAGSNVQDNCVLHADPGFPLALVADVAVGHGAVLHGCTIEPGVLVGMGAVVMNGARIGASCLLAANALVTEGKEFPDRCMVVGQPAKVVRTLDDATVRKIRDASVRYRARQEQYRAGMRRVGSG